MAPDLNRRQLLSLAATPLLLPLVPALAASEPKPELVEYFAWVEMGQVQHNLPPIVTYRYFDIQAGQEVLSPAKKWHAALAMIGDQVQHGVHAITAEDFEAAGHSPSDRPLLPLMYGPGLYNLNISAREDQDGQRAQLSFHLDAQWRLKWAVQSIYSGSDLRALINIPLRKETNAHG